MGQWSNTKGPAAHWKLLQTFIHAREERTECLTERRGCLSQSARDHKLMVSVCADPDLFGATLRIGWNRVPDRDQQSGTGKMPVTSDR